MLSLRRCSAGIARAFGCSGVGRVELEKPDARGWLQKPSGSFERCADPIHYGAPVPGEFQIHTPKATDFAEIETKNIELN